MVTMPVEHDISERARVCDCGLPEDKHAIGDEELRIGGTTKRSRVLEVPLKDDGE